MAKPEGLSKDGNTIAECRIKTADGHHKLYVQEWGNPGGVPILFLHGGPGGGCDDGHKNYFDPKRHRVIFLDQRGSGNSQPYGSLKNNETKYLVEDIELVRKKLSIPSWHVEGASWGSTLALCYAIKHPDKIKSLVILGVFLGTQAEIDWLEKGLYKNFYPEIYEQTRSKKLRYDNKSDQLAYLKMFSPLLGIDDRPKNLPPEDELDLESIKIELYYLNNNCFLPDNYILKNAGKITASATIIQGRYDMVCPPVSAYKLSRKLPDCKLHTTITGHLPSDRESSSVLKAILGQLG
jgi:proline iminopeptidase